MPAWSAQTGHEAPTRNMKNQCQMDCSHAMRRKADSQVGNLPNATADSRVTNATLTRLRSVCHTLLLSGLFNLPLLADPMAVFGTDTALTPDRFVRHFADFTFELGEELQPPEDFLQRKKGDCDDFASLASTLLTQGGYHTKLVVVVMAAQAHVVCYVAEISGFLDFNLRAHAEPVVSSSGDLEDIASKVSTSFRSDWLTASEFTYKDGSLQFLDTIFR